MAPVFRAAVVDARAIPPGTGPFPLVAQRVDATAKHRQASSSFSVSASPGVSSISTRSALRRRTLYRSGGRSAPTSIGVRQLGRSGSDGTRSTATMVTWPSLPDDRSRLDIAARRSDKVIDGSSATIRRDARSPSLKSSMPAQTSIPPSMPVYPRPVAYPAQRRRPAERAFRAIPAQSALPDQARPARVPPAFEDAQSRRREWDLRASAGQIVSLGQSPSPSFHARPRVLCRCRQNGDELQRILSALSRREGVVIRQGGSSRRRRVAARRGHLSRLRIGVPSALLAARKRFSPAPRRINFADDIVDAERPVGIRPQGRYPSDVTVATPIADQASFIVLNGGAAVHRRCCARQASRTRRTEPRRNTGTEDEASPQLFAQSTGGAMHLSSAPRPALRCRRTSSAHFLLTASSTRGSRRAPSLIARPSRIRRESRRPPGTKSTTRPRSRALFSATIRLIVFSRSPSATLISRTIKSISVGWRLAGPHHRALCLMSETRNVTDRDLGGVLQDRPVNRRRMRAYVPLPIVSEVTGPSDRQLCTRPVLSNETSILPLRLSTSPRANVRNSGTARKRLCRRVACEPHDESRKQISSAAEIRPVIHPEDILLPISVRDVYCRETDGLALIENSRSFRPRNAVRW